MLPAPSDNAAMQIDQPKSGQPKADPRKRKRRWFQFGLGSLMIVTLLA
jgi:hypothetical protein